MLQRDSRFTVDRLACRSVEHFMMAGKALLCGMLRRPRESGRHRTPERRRRWAANARKD